MFFSILGHKLLYCDVSGAEALFCLSSLYCNDVVTESCAYLAKVILISKRYEALLFYPHRDVGKYFVPVAPLRVLLIGVARTENSYLKNIVIINHLTCCLRGEVTACFLVYRPLTWNALLVLKINRES